MHKSDPVRFHYGADDYLQGNIAGKKLAKELCRFHYDVQQIETERRGLLRTVGFIPDGTFPDEFDIFHRQIRQLSLGRGDKKLLRLYLKEKELLCFAEEAWARQLSNKHRDVMRLLFLEGMTANEVAKEIGMSVSWIEKLRTRGIKALQAEIEEETKDSSA